MKVLLLAATALSALSVSADVFIWDGGGSGRNWTTANNWADNIAPNNDTTDDIQFGTGTKLNPRANAGWEINSIAFNAGSGAYVLSGFSTDEILLGAGGLVNNSASLQTVNQPLLFGDSQTWNAAAGNLAVGGSVNLYNFTLTSAGANDTIIGGIISGDGGLVKSGAGALNISGNNSFAGGIIASAGRLIAGSDTAFGAGSVHLSNDAKLEGSGSTRTINNDIQIAGSAKVGGTADMDINNPVSGSGTLVKEDANTVRLHANDTFSGTVQINNGVLEASGFRSLIAVTSIEVNGSGALRLNNTSGNAINDTAILTLNSGTLLANSQTEQLGTVNIFGNCNLTLSPDAVHGNITINTLNITDGQILQIGGWSYDTIAATGDVQANDDRLFVWGLGGGDETSVLARVMFDGFQPGARWDKSTGEITPVPEPGAAVMIAGGLLCLFLYRRRN